MVESVQQAKQEQTARPVTIPPELRAQAAATAASSGGQTIAGLTAAEWTQNNRIHIKDGSLFIDPYLALHPRELDPKNEAALRKKLLLTFSLNNPSFFEAPERSNIAMHLGELVPVSTEAKHSKLIEELKTYNAQADTGVDAGLTRELQDKKKPFAAIVRDVTQHPEKDPVGVETLKNSLAVYLLVREKLTKNGYLGKLSDYVQRNSNADQVVADLADKIGTTPLAFRAAALKGGVEGIGQLLGIEPAYVADVKRLTEYASSQDFGYNLVEHWHLGRQLQGIDAPLHEKLTVGIDARITAKISEWRNRVRQHFDVPEPVKKEQTRIADALNLVEPIQRALMYKLGYEICFSPEVNADDIAFYRGIYGLHRKAANDLRDTQGTYRIYFSGRGDLKGSMRTLVHEVAHNLWPDQFAPADVQKIDAYAASDQQRFAHFQAMLDGHFNEFEKLFKAYQAGNPQEKLAVMAAATQQFAAYGFQADGLFPYLRDAHDFQFAVKHINDTLSIEGERYNRSGYNSPEERFREVISRFAELKQVEYRGEPQFIQFLAPGLNSIWENHYLPHLKQVYLGMQNGTLSATHPHGQPRADEAGAQVPQPKVEEQPVPSPAVPPAAVVVNKTPVAKSFVDQVLDAPSNIINAASARLTPALNALANMNVGNCVDR